MPPRVTPPCPSPTPQHDLPRVPRLFTVGKAEKWYRKAVEADIRWAGFRIGCILDIQGDHATFDEWLDWSDQRGCPIAADYRAFALERSGQLAEAEKWRRRAAELDDPGQALRLGRESEERGDLDGAIRWYRQSAAHEYGPVESASALIRLASDPDEAERWRQAAGELRYRYARRTAILNRSMYGRLYRSHKALSLEHLTDRDLDELWHEHAPQGMAVCGIGPDDAAMIVGTIAVTTALVPFIKSIAEKAGEDAYKALRKFVLKLLRRKPETAEGRAYIGNDPARSRVLSIVIRDRDTGTSMLVPVWLPESMFGSLLSLDPIAPWCHGKFLYFEHGPGQHLHWEVLDGVVPIIDELDEQGFVKVPCAV